MERNVIVKGLSVLKRSYPHSFNGQTAKDLEETVALWQDMLENEDEVLYINAIKNIIRSDREFAPSVGVVLNEMRKLVKLDTLEQGEAWAIAHKSCSCDYGIAESNYKKLPSTIQKALGSPQMLVEIGYADNNQVSFIRNSFEKKYEANAKQDIEDFNRGLITASEIANKNILPNNEKKLSLTSKYGQIMIETKEII